MADEKTKSSTLIGEETINVETPNYTEDEQQYLKNLQVKLEYARDKRNQSFTEFDGLTYDQYWKQNEILANIELQPKKDIADIQYQSGGLRTKLFSLISSLISLNLTPEVSAYNENSLVDITTGQALEDVMEKTNNLEGDEEKQILRYYEMLKQGDVFLEEIWDDRDIIEKEPIKNYKGEFRGIKIKAKVKKQEGKPVRNIISGLSVYLGDLTKYNFREQPYNFTVQYKQYDEAKKIYGRFDNFKNNYVKKSLAPFSGTADAALINNQWRLDPQMKDGMVEIIRYEDKPNNEYQIILNGVPMLPIGFPFPWGYGEYNIVQQHYRPIRADFAYGKSFVFENKNPIQLLDEMKRLAFLKTYQSFLVPMINISGRVLSSKVLLPGKITMGIPPNALQPIIPNIGQGVTNPEFAMIQELQKEIDSQTVSQTFTGSPERGEVLATQIVELQRQARIMLGITIASTVLLEEKLAYLRLMNIIQNWFNPLDQVVDTARHVLENKYRITTTEKIIEDRGVGLGIVYPTEQLPNPDIVSKWENNLEDRIKMPVKITAIDPKALKEAKYTWVIIVVPKEKKTSEISKLLFNQMVTEAKNLGLPLDPAYIQEQFAEVWEKNPNKLYAKGQGPTTSPQVAPPGATPQVIPTIKKPILPVEGGKLGGEFTGAPQNPNLI